MQGTQKAAPLIFRRWALKMQNRRNGKEYENVVAEIGKALFELVNPSSGFQVKCGDLNKWTGISGYSHQIDVSVETHDSILLVECKNWSSTVDVPSFLTFLSRICDIRAKHKDKDIGGKVVTTRGYDPGVQTLASFYKIDTDIVKNKSEFLLQFRQYGISGVADQAEGVDRVKVHRECDLCGSDLVIANDRNSYVCPNCI